jgi:hypothetical protein
MECHRLALAQPVIRVLHPDAQAVDELRTQTSVVMATE